MSRRRTKGKKEKPSVWRSYSDMMSGLLLLFILIMAVCLMQAQKNYTEKLTEQAKLLKSQNELEESQVLLEEQQGVLNEQESELENQRVAMTQQESELAQKESEVASQRLTLAEQAKMLEDLQKALEAQQTSLDQKETEIELAKSEISQKETEIELAKQQISQKETEIELANQQIAQKESELQASQDELDAANDLMLEKQINLENSQDELDKANELMKLQQDRIDQIIGVKADLVEEINREFKKSDVDVQIDKETGAMILDSSVLYEFGESALTDEGEHILEDVLPVYCKVLLDGEHRDDIAEIIIDGYTDSVGDYESNLQLSQERAYAVAMYLLRETAMELTGEEQEILKSKLSVNGRSSSGLVLDENGEEDQEASRRVEIKFRLKDDEMIKELQSIIESSRIDDNDS